MIAENTDNEYAKSGDAFGLFKHTDAALFFGTPFRGTHEWFQRDMPKLVREQGNHVEDGVFDTFRRGNENLVELRKEFIDKCHKHQKPNIGFFTEMRLSNVAKIIGNEAIQNVSYLRIWC